MLNYTSDYAGESTEYGRYWKKFMGVTSTWESELKPISPARLAAQADAPILLIHGKDDTVVPVRQSDEMNGALKSAHKDVEYIKIPTADHWLLLEPTRVQMLKACVDFVLKNDPPD